MKKIYVLFCAISFTLTLSAQHVAPIHFQITSFNLDSLREANTKIPEYKTELEYIQKSLKIDATNLENAKKQLQEEKKLQKSATKYLEKKNKSLSSLEKNYQSSQKIYKSLREQCNGQRNVVRQMGALNLQNASLYEKMLNLDYSVVETNEAAAQQLLGKLSEMKKLNNITLSNWQNFGLEILQKETNLKALENEYKIKNQTIKNELKAIAEQYKNQ